MADPTDGIGYTVTGLTVGKSYTGVIPFWAEAGSADVFAAIDGTIWGAPNSAKATNAEATVTFTATATSHTLTLNPATAGTAGTVWALGFMLIVTATNLAYFNGSTPDIPDPLGGTLASYDWSGAADVSTSVETIPDLDNQEVVEHIGFYDQATGTRYLVITQADKTWLFDPSALTYTEIAPYAAAGCAQYQNRLYLVAHTTRGGWWGEATEGSGVYTYQSLAGGATPMPFGDQIVAYKDRLWIAGWGSADERTKVYLSDITNTVGGDINNWPLLNFIYVSRGDGQWITKLHPGANDLTIFRNGSAYYFHYDSDPVLGTLSRYDGNVGTENKYSTAVYQNYLYTLSNGALYQLVGYQFYRRNDPQRLHFSAPSGAGTTSVDAAISIIGSRCLVWYRGGLYAMNLNTFTWSQWESDTEGALFRVIPRAEGYFGVDVAYGVTGSGQNRKFGIYRVVDEINSSNHETMSCQIRTKAYDYGVADRNKVLFRWNLDALATGMATGTAVPITFAAEQATYDDLDNMTWDTIDQGTWDHLTTKAPAVITNRTSPVSYPARLTYQFIKKMRFRRIYYEVALDFDGSLSTGPVRIFGLVTYAEVRQKLARGVM